MINHDAPPLPVQATPHRSRNTKQPTPITKITQIIRKSKFRQPTTAARSGNPSPKQKHQTTNTNHKNHSNHTKIKVQTNPHSPSPLTHRSRRTKQPTPNHKNHSNHTKIKVQTTGSVVRGITKIIQITRKSKFRQQPPIPLSHSPFNGRGREGDDDEASCPRSSPVWERSEVAGVLMPCFSIDLTVGCLTGLCHRRSRPRHRRQSSSCRSAPAPRSG